MGSLKKEPSRPRSWGGKKAVQNLGQLSRARLSRALPSWQGRARAGGRGLSPRGPGSSAQRGAPHVLPATPCPLPTPDAQGAKKDLIGSLSPYRASRLVRACPLGQTTNHGPPYKGLLRGQPANSAPARDKRQSRVSFRREHRPRSTESPLPIRGCWEVRGWPSLVYKIISHGLHMNLLS